MEKVTTSQDDRLLDYLDGKLDGAALQNLKKELESSSLLNTRLEELRAIHSMLSKNTFESPSSLFVSKVMQNLHSRAIPSSLSPKNGLLLVGGVIIAAGILVAIISGGFFDSAQGMVSLEEVSPIKKYIQLPSIISIDGKLMINIIVGLNLVLAFIVLDRTVLKPFFQRRSGIEV